MINSTIILDNSSTSKVNAKVELYLGSTLVTTCTCDDRLQSLVIERQGEEGKFFGFGITHKLTLNLIDLERTLTNVTTANTFKVSFGVNDTFEYPYPTFYVTEVVRDETTNSLTITAYDGLHKADTAKIKDLRLIRYMIAGFITASANYLGFSGASTPGLGSAVLINYPEGANFGEDDTIRLGLNAAAEATQAVYYLNKDDKLIFKRLDKGGNPVLTISKDDYFSFESGEPKVITDICHTTELGDSTTGRLIGSKSGNVVSLNNVASDLHELTITATPSGSVEGLEVRSYGKNLIAYPYIGTTKTENGITFTDNGDGSITVNGTATADYVSLLMGTYLPLEDGVTYEFSGCDGKIVIKYFNENNVATWASWATNNRITWKKEYVLESIYIQVNTGDSYDNAVWQPMLRRADTSEGYEPYNGQVATVAADGSVSGILSIPTNMTIAINDASAKLSVKYKRQKESDGALQYVRDNPFWNLREDVQTLVDDSVTRMYGTVMTPFTCSWTGNFLLEVGDKIDLETEDGNTIAAYVLNDSILFDGTLEENTQWQYNIDTVESEVNPNSIGEVIKKTYARVDKINNEITQRVQGVENDFAQLKITTDKISTEIYGGTYEDGTLIEGLKSTVEQLPEEVKIEFRQELAENGVELTMGYKFNEEGLNIYKSGSEIQTIIDNDGMEINKVSQEEDGAITNEETLLTVNHNGVNATDLRARTYLHIGSYSRFENFGSRRTGCFWIEEVDY